PSRPAKLCSPPSPPTALIMIRFLAEYKELVPRCFGELTIILMNVEYRIANVEGRRQQGRPRHSLFDIRHSILFLFPLSSSCLLLEEQTKVFARFDCLYLAVRMC